MRKILFGLITFLTVTAMAQTKGRFEVHDFGQFKLHVYYTNDVMNDASFIVEGNSALVTLEQPLFRDNVQEYDAYVAQLNKPVEQRITNYHVGGTAQHDYVTPDGMAAFAKGPIYGGMMAGFQQAFGDTMTDLPTGKATEVAFGTTQTWAGVPFEFRHGASTDFPAASILIGGKIYYTHWAPARAHVSHLQVSSTAAIDAEIAEAERELASGCELFIGGHGGAADAEAVRFKIDYLKMMKKLRAEKTTPEAFASALKTAFPNLPGEAGVDELAKALYR